MIIGFGILCLASALAAPAFHLQSSAFEEGANIPAQYTAAGQNQAPPLEWSGAPNGTREFAVLVEDPDAPGGEPWVHWIVYKIPRTAHSLSASPKKPILQGKNSFGKIGYGGPQPPSGSGPHRYVFRLFAVDRPLKLPAGINKDQLIRALHGHVLGEAHLTGKFEQ